MPGRGEVVARMSSQRGQLLIASARLLDPNFVRTVVLIVRHDPEDGAMGLVLNRPLEMSVADACGDAVESAQVITDPIHQGGPCDGPLAVLHAEDSDEGEEIVPGVRFTMDREEIEQIMRRSGGPAKYFAGYSGWGPQQLEKELAAGGWLLATASMDDVFDPRRNQWSRLTTWLSAGKDIDPDTIPEDPSVN
jgi:putative transcriptional regulator